MMTAHRKQRTPRRAMTLMEMLLVLALIVVFAALAGPPMRNAMENRRLSVAAEALRTAWSKARVEAMKTGRIQGFRYRTGGEQYRLRPFFSANDVIDAEPVDFSDSEFVVSYDDVQQDKQLSEGIIFVASRQSVEIRGQEAIEADAPDDAATSLDENPWSPPILFYPDGTTSSAQVVLANGKGRAIEVTLRALTGTALISAIFSAEEAGFDELELLGDEP